MVTDPPLDSAEGIAIMMEWASTHRFVLNEVHEQLAEKYGVSTEGVTFSRPLAV